MLGKNCKIKAWFFVVNNGLFGSDITTSPTQTEQKFSEQLAGFSIYLSSVPTASDELL